MKGVLACQLVTRAHVQAEAFHPAGLMLLFTKRRVECILFLEEDELCLGNVIRGVVDQLSLSPASRELAAADG